MAPHRILFVCLGNICRSPLAEGLFVQELSQRGLEGQFLVDSAGTNRYHTGELPDARTRANAQKHGLTLTHRARTFIPEDFDAYDAILVMDNQNMRDVLALASSDEHRQKVITLRTYDPFPEDGQVPDPWFGGEEGFEAVFQIIKRSTQSLLNALEQDTLGA
jgi:protein-tyrosine phosphatase